MVAVRRVTVDTGPLNSARLNGIATSTDGTTTYVTVAVCLAKTSYTHKMNDLAYKT